uniref:Uncharacterized protein n=1 Tax=Alexandrium monilatum TaxID=311494 RepID=A0A7S4V0M4_9DINO
MSSVRPQTVPPLLRSLLAGTVLAWGRAAPERAATAAFLPLPGLPGGDQPAAAWRSATEPPPDQGVGDERWAVTRHADAEAHSEGGTLDGWQRADAEDAPGHGDKAEPKSPPSKGVHRRGAEDAEDHGRASADDANAEAPRDQGMSDLACQQQCGAIRFARSPLDAYLHRLNRGFLEYPHQWVVAAVGLGTGGLCIWNGPRTWRALFTAYIVGLASSIARIEAESWRFDMVSELLLMIQASLATGAAIQSGFDGFQVLFGTAAGFLVCYDSGGWTTVVDEQIPGMALLWYSLGAVLGALALTVWRQLLLVTIGPLTGGFLLSASVECLLARLVGACSGPVARTVCGALPPPGAPWIRVAGELLFLAGPGAMALHGGCAALATLVYKVDSTDEWRLPAALSLVSCVLVAGIGAWVRGDPRWLVGASAIWVLSAALSSHRQLGKLPNRKAKPHTQLAETVGCDGSQFVRQPSAGSYIFVHADYCLGGEVIPVLHGSLPHSASRFADVPPAPGREHPEDEPLAPRREDPEDDRPAPGLQSEEDPELGGSKGARARVVPEGHPMLGDPEGGDGRIKE